MIVYRSNPYWSGMTTAPVRPNGKVAANDVQYRRPATNIIERNDEYILQMALPGYSKKEIVIDIEQDILYISSQLEEGRVNDDQTIRREFRILPFERRFEIPDSIDQEKISASFKNGILLVALPKKEQAKTKPPREISID